MSHTFGFTMRQKDVSSLSVLTQYTVQRSLVITVFKLTTAELVMTLHIRAMGCHLPYGINDHTVLPATWHKWTHPTLSPARQAGTRFTGGTGGWVDLV